MIDQTYPIKGHHVPINNYTNWKTFMDCGMYDITNDNQKQNTDFGDEKDYQAAINLKIILEALLQTYKGDKVGSHYLADTIAPMVDHADDLIYWLGLYYDKD